MPNLVRGTAQCNFDTGDEYGTISPSYDVGNYNVNYTDCVLNKGDRFEVSISQSSLLASFSAGSQARIGGAFYELKQSASVSLPQNQTVYICLTIDKSQQDGSKADITLRSLVQIQYGNLYASDSIRDLPIYKVTTTSTSVSNVDDLRVIIGNTYIMKESAYNQLNLKEEYAIYELYED